MRVTGFPNRVDTIVTGLDLADPEAGLVLAGAGVPDPRRSPTSRTTSSSAWPGEQVVATPYDTLRVTGELLRGSVVFAPSPRLALDRATIEIEGMRDRQRPRLERRHRQGDPRHPPGRGRAAFAHDLAFNAEGLRAAAAMGARRRPRRRAARRRSERLALDATLGLRPRLGPSRGRGREPGARGRATSATSRSPGASSTCAGSGALVADAEGFAEGRLDAPRPQLARDARRRRGVGRARTRRRRCARRRPRPDRAARAATATPSTCRSTSATAAPASARSRSARRRGSPGAEAWAGCRFRTRR